MPLAQAVAAYVRARFLHQYTAENKKQKLSMSINLLPDEEKSKIKKDKKPAPTHIELTGPMSAEKHKPGVERRGVLMFFKSAFSRPQASVGTEQPSALRQFPEKKVRIEQRYLYEKPTPKPPPPAKPVFTPVPSESLQMKSHRNFLQKFFDWLGRLFGLRKRGPGHKAPVPATLPPEDQFPRYQPVKTEKVATTIPPSRSSEILRVVTQYGQPEPTAPPVTESVTLPARPIEPPVPEEKFVPLMPHREPTVTFEQVQKIKLEPPPARPAQHTEKPVKVPTVHRHISLGAWFKSLWQAIKKLFTRKKKPARPVVQPPVIKPVKPAPAVLHAPEPIVLMKPLPPAPPPHPAVTPATQLIQKQSGLMRWLKQLWNSITNIFRKKKPAVFSAPPPKPTWPPKPTMAPQPEKIVTLEHGLRTPPPPPAIHPAAPPPSVVPSSPLKPVPLGNVPPPPSGMTMTEPTLGSSGRFGWEVNLIPAEAIKVSISPNKIVILCLCAILACTLVFAGWLGSNAYYDKVTKKINDANQKLVAADITIRNYRGLLEQVRQTKDSTDTIQLLLDKHVYWKMIFTKLETYTIPEVYYTTMTADSNGSLTLSAVGKDYLAAIKQLKVYEQATDFITGVIISNPTPVSAASATASESTTPTSTNVPAGQGPVQFTIELKVLPTIFYYPQ